MMRRSTRWTGLLALILLASAACADEVLTPEVSGPDPVAEEEALVEAIEAIADQIGLAPDGSVAGMDDSDEAPAFGNTTFAEAFGAANDGREVDADLASDPTITSLAPDAVSLYHVMAIWGRIRPNRNTRWSGLQWNPALQVRERDAVRVRREILFEPGDEVHPQEVRHLVEMTSWTGPHVDGVVAQVAVRHDPILLSDATAPIEEPYFAFRSLPFSTKIPASELPGLDFVEIIDDTGNGVMLTAVRRPPTPCAFGFMGGRWARTSERGGVFGGVWQQANGRREGYLAGRWGVTAAGEKVFRGKIVNLQGEFLAFMAGNYDGGHYKGEIYGRNGAFLGYVRGRYTGEDGQGLFHGAWRQACDTETPPPCSLTADGVRECDATAWPEPTG
jgi:hypothetical protein